MDFETEFKRNFSKRFENNVNTDFYVPSWTFKSKKVFIVFETFRCFWIVAGVWRRESENFCENAMAGLPKLHFTCPGERFSGKQFFLGKLFSFQFLIVKEKIMTPAKDFSEGCSKSTLRFQLIAFTIKIFFAIFLLLRLFRTSSGRNFQLSTYIFCKLLMCILRIQMNTSRKKDFFGEDYQISSISDMETKIFREFLEIFRKQCLQWKIKCLRERYNWILFFFKFFFLYIVSRFWQREYQKIGGDFMVGLPKPNS